MSLDKFYHHINEHACNSAIRSIIENNKIFYLTSLQLYGTSNRHTKSFILQTGDSKYIIPYKSATVEVVNPNPDKGYLTYVNDKPIIIRKGFQLKQNDVIQFSKTIEVGPNYLFYELILKVNVNHEEN